MCVCIYIYIYIYIYIRLNGTYGRPVMHIAPRTGDRCFKETGYGYIKELTYAIIVNFILYFD